MPCSARLAGLVGHSFEPTDQLEGELGRRHGKLDRSDSTLTLRRGSAASAPPPRLRRLGSAWTKKTPPQVGRVTDMGWMFYHASQFNQALEKWNVAPRVALKTTGGA